MKTKDLLYCHDCNKVICTAFSRKTIHAPSGTEKIRCVWCWSKSHTICNLCEKQYDTDVKFMNFDAIQEVNPQFESAFITFNGAKVKVGWGDRFCYSCAERVAHGLGYLLKIESYRVKLSPPESRGTYQLLDHFDIKFENEVSISQPDFDTLNYYLWLKLTARLSDPNNSSVSKEPRNINKITIYTQTAGRINESLSTM